MTDFRVAGELLAAFKGKKYRCGLGVIGGTGELAAELGRKALLIGDSFPGAEAFLLQIQKSLQANRVEILGQETGARPNAPREDVFRLADAIRTTRPDVIISFGGGSTTDATKAAGVLSQLSVDLDALFGTGQVTAQLVSQSCSLIPHLAIQAAASSGAHLTKYSNITDLKSGQKRLIVDDAITPPRALFDYRSTLGAPASLTADGALDAISHALEVLYGMVNSPGYSRVEPVALEAIRLVITWLPAALQNPQDETARQALGLATDLGGYSIMLGGTNGAHLTSFSLVDILSHGRACGLLNPYYTVFFAPAVQGALREVGAIYRGAGYTHEDLDALSGRALGLAVARSMISFEETLGLPTRLADVPGFTEAHIERALAAAKLPELKMKLENMPIPMSADRVDATMGPILQSASTGDLDILLALE